MSPSALEAPLMPQPLDDEGIQPYTKAERLLNLVMALRGTRLGLDRDHIRTVVRGYDPRGSLAAFERMFERDKDELRSLGVPIATMTDPSGVVTGYRIEGDWTMPRSTSIGPSLRCSVWLLGCGSGPTSRPRRSTPCARSRLSSGCARRPWARPRSPGCRSTPGRACPHRGHQQAHGGIFDYRKATDSAPEARLVQPWGTVWWLGHWYLVGFDTVRDDVRVFRASRIEGAVRADPAASPTRSPTGSTRQEAIGRFAHGDAVALEVALAPGVAAALRQRAAPRDEPPTGPSW